ncbi:uncharacterized protein ANIA_08407 [Aspergillus nidulans FGSC A4]|uniref:Uncharacterized protein n=1 Tax=Emericella nidulans (strain FGSC A4 / ATCC 38163 / CBS 112.46 / NRRL 194 / M139) TaxID=227321 RepID=C8VEA7_EMENI|nr:hypothetical protein [Aspergillus nidulans FGSC A4]CBF80476.1 TPA: conserved hypothetical protein [Aspergillus nidulans FGSC A4]
MSLILNPMAPSISLSDPAPPLQVSHAHSVTKHPKTTIDVNIVEITPSDRDISSSSSYSSEIQIDELENERARLRRHIGLDSAHPPQSQPLFFIERVPDTDTAPIPCSLPGCREGIAPGSQRLALNPGMSGVSWFRSSSDYYHIPCFERIADFNESAYLNRLVPLTRNTFRLRGLKLSSVSDGSYLLSGGAERLILEWKVRRGMDIDKRDGVFDPACYELDRGVHALMYEAGSRGYWPSGRPTGLDMYEYYTLARTVAVNESGDGDEEEWNLFEAFLGHGEIGSGCGRHDLSELLERWEQSKVSSLFPSDLCCAPVRATAGTLTTGRALCCRKTKRVEEYKTPSVRLPSEQSGDYRQFPRRRSAITGSGRRHLKLSCVALSGRFLWRLVPVLLCD